MLAFPAKLHSGDEIRVLALSRSLGGLMQNHAIGEADIAFARGRLESLGLRVTFGRHVMECNAHLTAPIEARLDDLHDAWADPAVKAVLAVSGGVGAIQLLDGIDYELIARAPRILCGYSDIAYLGHAFLARAGVVSYYGPNFSSFMMRQGLDYTCEQFQTCLFADSPLRLRPAGQWSDDNWAKDQDNRTFLDNDGFWAIQQGEAQGTLIGGAAFILNLLQGSNFFPPLENTILFLESPSEGKASLMSLDTNLRALTFQPQFRGVRGLIIGRYSRDGRIDRQKLAALIEAIPALADLPVVANVDFGHTTPVMTLPNGGKCRLSACRDEVEITVTEH